MAQSNPDSPRRPTYVTEPFLPPLSDLTPYLEEIWRNKILTNCGPIHERLERALCEYLDVPHISLFNNGTIALIVALQALELRGDVITTPYTFVASTNAIVWNGLKPVFADILPTTLNLDPSEIESRITPRTSAILAVHCYGNPCDVEAIEAIGQKYGLKIIYDAAHAFGVQCHCGSILNHGDLSVLSFHATKVFNTFEGGAIVSKTPEMKQKIDRLRNFGFARETEMVAVGINGKLSEIHAAMGLAQLKYLEVNKHKRQAIDRLYRTGLSCLKGISLLPEPNYLYANYSYFPILVTDDYPLTRDQLQEELNSRGILPRRYFFPLVPQLYEPLSQSPIPMVAGQYSNATTAARQILCLPQFTDLGDSSVYRVMDTLQNPLSPAMPTIPSSK